MLNLSWEYYVRGGGEGGRERVRTHRAILIVKDSNVHGCYETKIEMFLKLIGKNAAPIT
jgi:hypothetical protein